MLFISYITPFKPVATVTISRWIRSVLALSGIDVTKFKTHSTRCASTSKAKQFGVSISEILKVAGWGSDRTFAQFYEKPIECEGSFQDAVLK